MPKARKKRRKSPIAVAAANELFLLTILALRWLSQYPGGLR